MTTRLPLLPLVRGYIERDPGTAARHLQALDETEAVSVLKVLPPHLSALVFPYLETTFALAVLQSVSGEVFSDIVRKMRPEQAADILVGLEPGAREPLLAALPERTKESIQELLTFPRESAGRIMSTSYMAFDEQSRVRDAVHRIRVAANRNVPTTYAYVLGEDRKLAGVLNMRDLLIAPSDAVLSSVMHKDVFAVKATMDREEVAQQLLKRHYFAAPVVDADGRLLGVVKTDQLIGHVREEAAEDMLMMAGVGRDESVSSSIPYSLKKRLPWLHVNLATAFLAASVVSLFQDVIAKITILAVYLPVVAGQGGNAGAQSLAVVMRGLVLREIKPADGMRIVMKEGGIGALNGLVIGLVTGLVAWFWNGNPFLGVVIGLAMIVNLVAAGVAGAGIPLAMKAVGFDPAQSSSIIMTTVTDVVGFFAFLGFAVVFQARLIP